MPLSSIRVEDELFVKDGETGIGAVRDVKPDRLIVYIEGYGEIEIGPDHIADAHDGKVMLRVDRLPSDLQERIDHVHDAEYRRPSDSTA
ncbi:hypothetical protein [uncultured Jannaschia sp.]|uniref:hypothetical protein n=1 Tax=uncultured Jannaschia sp. TaxID=293347 RepID=UPI00261DC8D2|nr:hypothetical protein [uncultured Jannaschia sp.]